MVLQIPENFNINTTPLLTSMSDQGGINRAGLDYLAFKIGMPISVQWDCFHRGWNDVRHCMKSSKGQLFKVFLSFALLWNVSYGPYGSKEWFSKRLAKLHDMMATSSPHSEPFISFIPLICQERHIEGPTDSQGRERLWDSLRDMNCMCALGPIVKLMRWFSWFEAEQYYQGQNWAMKLIMLEEKHVGKNAGYIISEETAAGVEFLEKDLKSHKDELRKLKMSHGTFSLAPLLVSSTSMWQKDLLKLLCQPSWSIHASRAKTCLTPQDHVNLMMKSVCQGMWKEELLGIMRQGFLTPSVLKLLYPPLGTSQATTDARLEIHSDFLCKLLAKRSMSICAQFLLPPIRYAGLLGSPQQQKATQTQMLKDWEKILKWEALAAKGENIEGLDSLHFLQSSFCRLGYLLNEDDVCNQRSQAQVWMKAAICHHGDSAIIENSHQAAKDTLRDARHNQRSRVHKQMAVINSKVLQTRKTPHVSVNELELSQISMKNLPAFAPMTHPNSHKMRKEYQNLMQHKSGKHFWHSSSAVSQYEEFLAFELLLKTEDLSSMQLSCLAGNAGTVLLSDSQGLALLVLAKGMHGFTAWILEPLQVCGARAFKPIDRPEGLVVQHITQIDAWQDIPCKPVLLNSHGALILMQDGPPVPLPVARIHAGLNLTVKQCKQILLSRNIKLKGTPSKAEVYKALIAEFIEDESARDKLLALSTAKMKEEGEEPEDQLSDYEDLLDLVEEDCNHDDPDIKQEKKKLKRKRLGLGKVKKTGDDSILLGPKENKVKKPKMKAKAKAKPSAKGKGRARGRGRGKAAVEDNPDRPPLQDKSNNAAASSAAKEEQIPADEIAKLFDESEPENPAVQAASLAELEEFFADSPPEHTPKDEPSKEEVSSHAPSASAEAAEPPSIAPPQAASTQEVAAGTPHAPEADAPSIAPSQVASTQELAAGTPHAPEAEAPSIAPSQVASTQELAADTSNVPEAEAPAFEQSQAARTQEVAADKSNVPEAESPAFEPSQAAATQEVAAGIPIAEEAEAPTIEPSQAAATQEVAAGIPIAPEAEAPTIAPSQAAATQEVAAGIPIAPEAEAPTIAPSQAAATQEVAANTSNAATAEAKVSSSAPEAEPEAAPIVPASSDAAEPAGPAGSRTRGPKVFASPASLADISPPGCSVRLNRIWACIGVCVCGCFPIAV